MLVHKILPEFTYKIHRTCVCVELLYYLLTIRKFSRIWFFFLSLRNFAINLPTLQCSAVDLFHRPNGTARCHASRFCWSLGPFGERWGDALVRILKIVTALDHIRTFRLILYLWSQPQQSPTHSTCSSTMCHVAPWRFRHFMAHYMKSLSMWKTDFYFKLHLCDYYLVVSKKCFIIHAHSNCKNVRIEI